MLMHLMVGPAVLQLAVLALLQSLLMPGMQLPAVACQKLKAMHLQAAWVQLQSMVVLPALELAVVLPRPLVIQTQLPQQRLTLRAIPLLSAAVVLQLGVKVAEMHVKLLMACLVLAVGQQQMAMVPAVGAAVEELVQKVALLLKQFLTVVWLLLAVAPLPRPAVVQAQQQQAGCRQRPETEQPRQDLDGMPHQNAGRVL